MSVLKFCSVLFLALVFASESIAKEEKVEELNEEFTEALLLRPLPDRKVLAHFHFRSSAPPSQIYGRHHHIFPKSIYQLGFLHIDEYPPHANQGFDVPSAVIRFDSATNMSFHDNVLKEVPIIQVTGRSSGSLIHRSTPRAFDNYRF